MEWKYCFSKWTQFSNISLFYNNDNNNKSNNKNNNISNNNYSSYCLYIINNTECRQALKAFTSTSQPCPTLGIIGFIFTLCINGYLFCIHRLVFYTFGYLPVLYSLSCILCFWVSFCILLGIFLFCMPLFSIVFFFILLHHILFFLFFFYFILFHFIAFLLIVFFYMQCSQLYYISILLQIFSLYKTSCIVLECLHLPCIVLQLTFLIYDLHTDIWL